MEEQKKSYAKYLGPIFVIGLGALLLTIILGYQGDNDSWSGMRGNKWEAAQDKSTTGSTKVEKRVKVKDLKSGQEMETETVTTYVQQDPKKLWDWLGLLGVPAGLAAFGYYSQVFQQRRADREEAIEKKLAETRQQEEAFQNYIDRMSELLINRNLIAVAKNLDAEKALYVDFLTKSSIKRAIDLDINVLGLKNVGLVMKMKKNVLRV
jgi:hypothetical protein